MVTKDDENKKDDGNKKEPKDYYPGARYCSETAATELFFTSFLHGMGALTGCGHLIDTKVTTDHYRALDRKKSEMKKRIQAARWYTIKNIMALQTSQKAQGGIHPETISGVDETSVGILKDMLYELEKQDKLNSKSIQDKLDLFNFSAITSCIFLYIISFVLIVFVKWN